MATRVIDPAEAGSGSSSGPVKIRPMRDEDLGRVLAIERASFAVPWTPATFAGLLGRPDAHLLVAECVGDADGVGAGELVGYAAVWVVLDQAELGDIAVDAPWRGRGIGATLLARVLELTREHGVKELYLEVRVSNEGAQRLYARHGFEVVGRRPGYYARPREDALVMRKVVGV